MDCHPLRLSPPCRLGRFVEVIGEAHVVEAKNAVVRVVNSMRGDEECRDKLSAWDGMSLYNLW